MPAVEKTAAAGGHLLLYAFMFALPFTGWALVSASVLSIPTVLYGILPWPDLPLLPALDDKASAEAVLKLVHAYGAYAFIALVAVHSAAAVFSIAGIASGKSGERWDSRHASRRNAARRTVMPIDLCI